MEKLYELKNILEQESLMNQDVNLETRYASAVRNPEVRDFFELETPQITDLTGLLQVENNGRLYAVRMDLNEGVDDHKKQVVAGLILRGVLKERIPKETIDTLIDGGNFNSGKAFKYYAEKLGFNYIHVMSRLFPQHIIDLLKSNRVHVIQAPRKEGQGKEREFYSYLRELMTKEEFRKNKYCLWHAKDGGKAMYPFGIEIAEKLETVPNYVISCLGAGSTLEGLQIAVQDYFKGKPSIIIAEHELSPLFAQFIDYEKSKGSPEIVKNSVAINPNFYESIDELPHIVIGPHYDEINPLISKKSIERIDKIVQYSEDDWMAMQKFLAEHDISVGNSSAANINAAAQLANEGNNVLTVVFEPFREFYKKQHDIPWLFRWETLPQKIALTAAVAGWFFAGFYYLLNVDPNAPPLPY